MTDIPPAVVCTEAETYCRYKICNVVGYGIEVHNVCRQLRKAGVAHDSHNEEGRAALGLLAESLQGHRELGGVDY